MTGHRARWPYLLLGPAVLIQLLVHVIPAALGIESAFRRLTPTTIARPDTAPFIGWDNFAAVLSVSGPLGDQLWSSLARSAAFTVLVVGIAWSIGVAAALMLQGHFRGSGFLRVFFLIPFALPVYASVLGWRLMFARDNGMINHVLVDQLGILDERPFWLIGDNAFTAMVIVAVWRLWPFVFLMLLAALRTVDPDLHEAAALDGANWRQRHWHLTRPALRRINAVVLLVAAVWTFNDFSTPHLLFAGNPPEAALLMPNMVYRNAFGVFELGTAAAVNTVVLALAAILVAIGGLGVVAGRRKARRG